MARKKYEVRHYFLLKIITSIIEADSIEEARGKYKVWAKYNKDAGDIVQIREVKGV